jgi:hypothetical protein
MADPAMAKQMDRHAAPILGGHNQEDGQQDTEDCPETVSTHETVETVHVVLRWASEDDSAGKDSQHLVE